MPDPHVFTPQLTDDGSLTFFSTRFGEAFHSHYGARQEAERKFVEPAHLTKQAHKRVVRVLDICYGLGYNSAAAFSKIWEINPHCRIEWVGLELDPSVPNAAIDQGLLVSWPTFVQEQLIQIARVGSVQTEQLQAQLLLGDARQTIVQVVNAGFQADAIFLDPFSPRACPQLWTVEFLNLVAQCLHPEGYLATYSCSAAVRTAMLAAGLKIGSTPPVGRRSPGTVACHNLLQNEFDPSVNLPKLSQQEQEHLKTRAAIPYRDPHLCEPANIIESRRQAEQETSNLEPTSHWKKRWNLRRFPQDSRNF